MAAALGTQRTVLRVVEDIPAHIEVRRLLRGNLLKKVEEFAGATDDAGGQLPVDAPVGLIHPIPQIEHGGIGQFPRLLPLASEGPHGGGHIHAAAQGLFVLLQHNDLFPKGRRPAARRQAAAAAADDYNITGLFHKESLHISNLYHHSMILTVEKVSFF